MNKLYLSFVIALATIGVYGQPGTLDTTFNYDGTVVTLGTNNAYAVAIQPDGYIVVAGGFDNGSDNDVALARYEPDGKLDTTFGTYGKVTTSIGNSDEYAYALALQIDSKIIIAGSTHNGSNNDVVLVRYTVNGVLDNSFGTGGIVTTAIGSSDDYAYGMALQTNGKIIVAGSTNNGSDDDIAVLRYNIDGALDTTFGTNGITITPIGTTSDIAKAVVIQPDGKIVAAGYIYNGANHDFTVVRYNTNGTPDTTFGTNGIVTTPMGNSDDYAHAVALQADGKIVIGGSSDNLYNDDFAVARYNTNGTLDNTFGTGGKVITANANNFDYVRGVAIQPDGKIVAAGYTYNASNADFATIRYNTNGTLDNIFGANGKAITPVGTYLDYGYAVTIQPDNKIVVAGSSFYFYSMCMAVVRYFGGGTVGMNEEKVFTDNDITIQPNPFTINAELRTNEQLNNATLNIYDITGRKVRTIENINDNKIIIERNNLQKGIYFVYLQTHTKILTKRLIIQ